MITWYIRRRLGGLHSSLLIFPNSSDWSIFTCDSQTHPFITVISCPSSICGSAVRSTEVCKSSTVWYSSPSQIWFASASSSIQSLFSSLDPRQVRLQASKSFTELTLVAYYRTSRVDVNCADKFHTRRRRVVRRVYTNFLRSRSKKCVIHVPLLFGAIIFPYISLLYEKKGLLCFKKRRVDNGKFT